MSLVNAYHIYLNSENGVRIQGKSDYIRWDLQNKLTMIDKSNYFTVKVLHANIPFSFHEFPEVTINGTYIHLGTPTNFSFVIPSGNYSMTNLNQKFIDGFLAITHPHNWDLTIVYDSAVGTNLYTFTSNQPFSFTFTFNNYWRSAGFKTTDTLAFSDTTTLTSSRHPVVNRINSLLLRSDTLAQDHRSQEFLVDDMLISEASDILAKIPIYTGYNSFIIYQADESNPPVRVMNQDISYIQLYVTSNISYTLDLRDLEWTCALRIEEWSHPKKEEPLNYAENQESLKLLANLKEQILQDLHETRTQLLSPQEEQN